MMKMKKTSPILVAVLSFCCSLAVSVLLAAAQHRAKRKITDPEVKAIIQAAEDEIYDYGYEEEYHVVDAPACGPRKNSSCIRIYINPEIDADGTGGEVIYILMPFAEVFRDYGILDNGLAVLEGDPHNQFNPTDEFARKTAYMDEDLVFRMKRDWIKAFFVVDESPDPKRVAEASRRQKLRTGHSHREEVERLKKHPSQ